MLEIAIAEAAEHAERMLKTFQSGCAVAEDLLQGMIDKLEVVRQHAVGATPAVVKEPTEPPTPTEAPAVAAAVEEQPAPVDDTSTIAADGAQPTT